LLNDATVPTIFLNSINQTNSDFATEEKQEEILNLLHLILAKTQEVRSNLDN